MKPVRLGIVGCGDIAQYTALFGRLSRRIHLTAACDIDLGRAERFARRFGMRTACQDYAALLGSDIDAVYLATPHHLHAGMIRAAVAAGKAVFVEKPVTRTWDEGQEIARLAEETGAKVAVNYQYRYDPGCYALARAVQRGELGEIHSLRMNVPWRREASYFSSAAWHARLDTAGGGTLLTQGSHILDVALWAMGEEVPVQVLGRTARRKFKDVEVEDLAHAVVEFSNGALGQIASTMAAAREGPVTLEVYGERASAFYTGGLRPRVRFVGRRVRAEKPPVGGLHALQSSLEGFARWVQGGEPHLCTARDALPVLAVVEAVYAAAQSGCGVKVTREPVTVDRKSDW
jgi:UDP-N-acetyl-2-amino-2-deoxyglucuronate dehydrogenase